MAPRWPQEAPRRRPRGLQEDQIRDKKNAICDCYPDSIDIAEEEARYLRGRSPISLADVFIYSSRASTLARENESADAANMQQIVFQGVDTNQAIIELHRGKATSSPSSTHA